MTSSRRSSASRSTTPSSSTSPASPGSSTPWAASTSTSRRAASTRRCPRAARSSTAASSVSPATSPLASSTSAATTRCGTPAAVPPTPTPSARHASAVSCRRSSSQVNPGAMVSKYPEVARIAKDNIYTDIPAQNLPAYVDLIERVQRAQITSVALTKIADYSSVHPDYDPIRSARQEGHRGPQAVGHPVDDAGHAQARLDDDERRPPRAPRRRPTSSADRPGGPGAAAYAGADAAGTPDRTNEGPPVATGGPSHKRLCGDAVSLVRGRSDRSDQSGRTASACGPLGPWVTSNSTRCASSSER